MALAAGQQRLLSGKQACSSNAAAQLPRRCNSGRRPAEHRSCSGSGRSTRCCSIRGRQTALRVMALDAAQPFDFEHRMKVKLAKESKLTIGIIGFGTFGQFMAKRLVQNGHRVLATSRSPYHEEARAIGVDFFTDVDDFCEEHPEVVILASSILSTEKVLKSLPVQRLKRSTLFVDVLSVKVFPKQLMLRELPPEMDILCTHPMFGPDSGRGSWQGLNLMYEKVRVGDDPRRQARVDKFLRVFASEGCRMVDMSCEEHDRQAASTQFITHTVGRVLGTMQLSSTEINTKGFDALLNLVNNTAHDSFDLYYGLFLYNTSATDELERLEQAFDHVKKQLFARLHEVARQQLFPDPERAAASAISAQSSVTSSLDEGSGGAMLQLPAPQEALAGDAGSSSSNGSGSSSANGRVSMGQPVGQA